MQASLCGSSGGRGLHQERLLHAARGVLVSDHHRTQHGWQIHLHPPGDSPHLITTTAGKSTYQHLKEGVAVMHLILLVPSRCHTGNNVMHLKPVTSNGWSSKLPFNLAHLRQQQSVSLLPSNLPCLPGKLKCKLGCSIQLLRS